MPYVLGNIFFNIQHIIQENSFNLISLNINMYVANLVNIIVISALVLISDKVAYYFIKSYKKGTLLLISIYIVQIIILILIFIINSIPIFLTNVYMSDYMYIFVINIMAMLYLCFKNVRKIEE